MGNAPPYYLRLRIYARQIDYFYRHLREQDPVYEHCPGRCLAPEADRENGCPDCEYKIRLNTAKGNYSRILEKELTRLYKEAGITDPEKYAKLDAESGLQWEHLARDYAALCELERKAGTETADSPGGIDPSWNIRIDTGIAIIREERYKVRREVRHRDKQEADAKAAAERAKRGI